MSKPNPLPPLRAAAGEARASVQKRRLAGAGLFADDRRYSWEMHERFERWIQETATELENLFWSPDVANWFRTGTCWLVGSGSYDGIIETRDDRLKVLDEILSVISSPPAPERGADTEYDVCLSFAGEQRPYVDEVAKELRNASVRVFYDDDEQVDLWGKDLYEHLNAVYRDRARYCVMFISKEYGAKLWTSHERKSAQARAFRERREYILPARFDDTELPGLNETVGYIDLRRVTPQKLAAMIVKKLAAAGEAGHASPPTEQTVSVSLPRISAEDVAIEALYERRDVRIESEKHEYRLLIDLHNVGRKKVTDWRIQVWFPNAFLSDAQTRVGNRLIEEHDGHYFDEGKRLLPGDRLHVLDIDYFVDNENWPNNPFLSKEKLAAWKVRIRISADGMAPWEAQIPMGQLQNF